METTIKSTVQEIIISQLQSGSSKTFVELFNAVEEHYHLRWVAQAEDFKLNYDDFLVKKRGEIYTYLIADGNVQISTNDGVYRWILK